MEPAYFSPYLSVIRLRGVGGGLSGRGAGRGAYSRLSNKVWQLVFLAQQAFPPGGFFPQASDDEGVLTFAALPSLELFVVISPGTAATGAGASYFSGCLFIEVFPVIVVPTGTKGHSGLPRVRFHYSTVLRKMVSFETGLRPS